MKKTCIANNWMFQSKETGKIEVDLPHDYSIKLPRSSKAAGGAGNGFFEGSEGEYIKYLPFGNSERYILDIDGAYMCARIYFNDNLIDFHPNGYMPYLVDLKDKVRKGRHNKIKIVTQNLQPSTRWYSGAGLYRDVYLWSGGAVRIEPWDMFVTTASIADGLAKVCVSVTLTSDMEAKAELVVTVLDGDNAVVSVAKVIDAPAGKSSMEIPLEILNPKLWDTENPHLYKIVANISVEGVIVDTFEDFFGIRTISADARNGFMLNGKSMKLRGGCIHHDHGALGAAEYPAAVRRKITRLKEAGFNAVRTAHNPPSLTFLHECDRLGMLVMDEAFDMWNEPKTSLDYSLWFKDWWARDISYMVLRDRSHPSVISYSIGNEIRERDGCSDGAMWARKLSDEIRKYDRSRFVTSGVCGVWKTFENDSPEDYKEDFISEIMLGDPDMNHGWEKKTAGFVEPLDIVGYNYRYDSYISLHQAYPERVMWGSETRALEFYKSWSLTKQCSYVIGDFTWTAYDNIGEAGTGRSVWKRDGVIKRITLADYPWRCCYQGDLDLCGYRRPQSYFREAVWLGNTEPHIFTTHPEHYGEEFSGTGWHWYDVNDTWTYEDCYIGKPVRAEVYTDADEIEFILNGNSLGLVKPIEAIARMDIVYEPGCLTAVSYKNGRKVKEFSLNTVGAAKKVIIVPEQDAILADNRDICFLEIYIADGNGNRVPDSTAKIDCQVAGGELLGIFSGSPDNEDDYASASCHAFYGRALAAVRTKHPGSVAVCVVSEGLKSGYVTINAV